MKRLLLAFFLTAAGAAPGLAQEGTTVQSLLDQGYEIKAMMPSSAGPGILLQKETDLVMCFVAETPTSADIVTQYCKPVH